MITLIIGLVIGYLAGWRTTAWRNAVKAKALAKLNSVEDTVNKVMGVK